MTGGLANGREAGRRWAGLICWLAFATLTPACGKESPAPSSSSGGSSSSEEVPGLFKECTPGQQCEEGTTCVPVGDGHRCEHLCQTDADCGFTIKVPVEEVTTVCSTIGPDLMACRAPCDRHYVGEFKCVDGHSVSCSALPETECTVCDCPDSKRCEDQVGCQAKRELGEECLVDRDCVSDNCDPFAHICRVPVGTACTAFNCERCINWKNGTFCSRSCNSILDCDDRAGCNYQECRPLCAGELDPSCPGDCVLSYHPGGGNPDIHACLCDPMACKALEPPPDVGSQCDEDSDCGPAGVCLMHNQFETGFCSRRCSADAPCSTGRSCVDVPCGQSDPDTCGALCLNDCTETEPRCSSGNCHPLPTIDAQTAEVCDYRRTDGERCQAHSDCQSGFCMDAKCATLP